MDAAWEENLEGGTWYRYLKKHSENKALFFMLFGRVQKHIYAKTYIAHWA